MVDANQGWRMPGDLTPRWELATAVDFARDSSPGRVLARGAAPTDDLEGYAALRAGDGLRIAAGEMVRTEAEARELLTRGGVDVSSRTSCSPAESSPRDGSPSSPPSYGRTWSPHTWSNGYGLLANLHAALAFSTCPYLEVPLDPPAWPATRRDWLLPSSSRSRRTGRSAAAGPGLGVVPDFDALERYRIG